jgi:hypothetical protein
MNGENFLYRIDSRSGGGYKAISVYLRVALCISVAFLFFTQREMARRGAEDEEKIHCSSPRSLYLCVPPFLPAKK